MTVVVTYRTDVMFYEERVPTRWNHEQHNEISPMEAATIQRWSESKFLDKAQVKRRSFHTPNLIQPRSTLEREEGKRWLAGSGAPF